MTTQTCFGEYGQHSDCLMVLNGKPTCGASSSCRSKTVGRRAKNKEGYNGHKVDPNPKEKVLSKEDQFKKLPLGDQKQEISKVGNQIWKDSKALTTKKQWFSRMNNIFFGFDFGEK